MTVPQLREIFARLLAADRPNWKRIGAEISRVLRRSEEARIYHWYKATGKFPPPDRQAWFVVVKRAGSGK